MPDANHPQSPRPPDWAGAFAALPQEAPPERAWDALSARLDARRARRWPAWLALAAVLALVALLPLRRAGDAPANGATPSTATQVAATPSQPVSMEAHEQAVAASPAAMATAGTGTRSQPAATPGDASPPPLSATPARTIAQAAAPAAAQASPKRARATAVPATGIARADAARQRTVPDRTASRLQPLYAESARLEALLALARDDRVASASAVVVADALDAQVAAIDAALSDPALDDARRIPLWRDRIEALRQAAGFESTQRLLASQGNGDALLASVD
jgi:hypothetical protein